MPVFKQPGASKNYAAPHCWNATDARTNVEVWSEAQLTPHQQQEAKRRRDAGESLSEIGRLFGVNYRTIGRL
jgi:hypothetical protein